jgi:hypothetical protein
MLKQFMHETTPNSIMKKQMLMYITGFVLVAIILIGSIWYALDVNKKAEDKKKEDEKTAVENKKKQDEELVMQAADLAKMTTQKKIDLATSLSGKAFSGTKISLLNSALVFPTGQLSFAPAGAFSLEIKGLDLATLGNPELKVGAVYPTISGVASGVGVPAKDGNSYDLNVTNLQLQFLVGLTPLDAASSSVVVKGLAKAGVVIPTATAQNPVIVNAVINSTTTGISVKSSATSTYLFNFEGNLLL